MNNDILGTLTSGNDKKLEDIFRKINNAEKGAIVFINQEVKSLELLNRISELKVLQGEGEMRAPQIKMDTKDFGIGTKFCTI